MLFVRVMVAAVMTCGVMATASVLKGRWLEHSICKKIMEREILPRSIRDHNTRIDFCVFEDESKKMLSDFAKNIGGEIDVIDHMVSISLDDYETIERLWKKFTSAI